MACRDCHTDEAVAQSNDEFCESETEDTFAEPFCAVGDWRKKGGLWSGSWSFWTVCAACGPVSGLFTFILLEGNPHYMGLDAWFLYTLGWTAFICLLMSPLLPTWIDLKHDRIGFRNWPFVFQEEITLNSDLCANASVKCRAAGGDSMKSPIIVTLSDGKKLTLRVPEFCVASIADVISTHLTEIGSRSDADLHPVGDQNFVDASLAID